MQKTVSFKKKIIATAIASIAAGFTSVVFAQQNESVDEVVVTGIKGAQESAINTKREATSIVDGISAEDIGKLPDVTIADSLQRIAGVQVQRSAGEGTTANVRGLPQVVTLLNGEQYLTAGNLTGAQPNLGDIPSQLMKGVNVFKSEDLHNALSGVTGTIDLKTRRPFDMAPGYTAAVGVDVSTGSYTKQTDPSVNGLVNWRGDNVGVMLSGVTSKSNLGNNYSGVDGGWEKDNSWGGNNGSGYNYVQANGYNSFNEVVERQRNSLNAAFQADLGEGFKFLAEDFYTKLESHDRKMGLNIGNRWFTTDWMTATKFTNTGAIDPKAAPGSTDARPWASVQQYNVNDLWTNSFAVDDTVNSQSNNVNLQLDYDNGGNFTSSVRAIHGTAVNHFSTGSVQGDLSNWKDQNTKQLWRNQLGIVGQDSWFGQDTSAATYLPNFYPASVAAKFPNQIVGTIVGDKGGRYIDPNPLGYGQNPQLTYNVGGDHPVWGGFDTPIAGGLGAGKTLRDYMANLSSYSVGAYDGGGNDSTASMNVFSATGKYKFDEKVGGFITAIEAGVRTSARHVDHLDFKYFSDLYTGSATNPAGCGVQWKAIDVVLNQPGCQAGEMVPNPLAGKPGQPATVFQGYTAEPPTRIDQYQKAIFVTNFGKVTSGLPGVWVADPHAFDDMQSFLAKTFGNAYKQIRPGNSFQVSLDELSAYSVAYFESGMFTGSLGAKIIQTTITTKQNVTGPTISYGDTQSDVGDTLTDRTYNDVLPALNVAANISDEFKVRFAATKTMTPLDLGSYGGGLTVSTADDLKLGIRTVTGASAGGNPNLNPWRAENYDLSAEYYLGKGSMLDIAAYKIDISSFVAGGTTTGRFPDADGVIRRTVNVSLPIQGKGGSITGFEVGGKFAFGDITDGFLKNFGSDVNFTYAPSKSNEKDMSGNDLPFYDNSKTSYNVVGWYQDDKFQARLAYNYRSERYAGDIGVGGPKYFTQPAGYVDASVSYEVLENVTVTLDGSNLTNEREETRIDFSKGQSQFAKVNEFEARYTLGVRAKF